MNEFSSSENPSADNLMKAYCTQGMKQLRNFSGIGKVFHLYWVQEGKRFTNRIFFSYAIFR